MEAAGMNGQLHFDGVNVTLTRKGFWARSQVGLGEQRFLVRDITAVNWKPASKIGVNGFIQFALAGDVRRRPRYGQRNLDAARDDLAVTFRYRQMPAFQELRAAIDDARAGGTAPTMGPVASPLERMKQLQAARAAGLISEAEFEAKRLQIINAM